MMVYKKSSTQPFKWLLALVVFMAVMSITFTDVYGIQVNTSQDKTGEPAQSTSEVSLDDARRDAESGTMPSDNPGSTVPVPEPMTLILLAGGLTAMYTARRLRKKA